MPWAITAESTPSRANSAIRLVHSDGDRITLSDWGWPVAGALVAGVPGRLGLVADPYHGLAADYDWIFDDSALVGGAAINQPATARLLQRTGTGGDVLDAACGTGIDAAARFRREGLAIAVQRC